MESPQGAWLGGTDTPSAEQTSLEACKEDMQRVRGKGVGRGTLGGEERRPGDETALPPRSLAEVHSPPAVMPGKRQQVSSRPVQSQAGRWGQLAARNASSVLLRESVEL